MNTSNMAEEKIEEIEETLAPASDDVDVLRVLLHTVRGISPVSTSVQSETRDE